MYNKICTLVEQSKKLIELGIDVNTADMHYSTWTILNEGYILSSNQGQTIEELQEDYGNQIIPAWSLSALLRLMPERIKIEEELSFCLTSKKSPTGYSFGYNLNGSIFVKDNPVDAAFKMVCWLKENGKI